MDGDPLPARSEKPWNGPLSTRHRQDSRACRAVEDDNVAVSLKGEFFVKFLNHQSHKANFHHLPPWIPLVLEKSPSPCLDLTSYKEPPELPTSEMEMDSAGHLLTQPLVFIFFLAFFC